MRPTEVRDNLSRSVLVDGSHLVLDTEHSRGAWLVEARTGDSYLDLYTFFASRPLGTNPARPRRRPEFTALLAQVACTKPANPDVLHDALRRVRRRVPPRARRLRVPHLSFVEGGALAVENALKVAFDWKSRHNGAAGRLRSLGTKVLHLTHAFHGGSGYTMSLTETDPTKTTGSPSSTGRASTPPPSGSPSPTTSPKWRRSSAER